jgi:CO dehydrogenase/acetyl-CoA synthase alpha subunit
MTIVKYGSTYVRVIGYGSKQVTYVRSGGAPVTVDSERLLPEDIKELIGY